MTTALSHGMDDADLSVPAVDCLADAKETAAIEPLLRALARLEWASEVHARIVARLPDFGPTVIPPLLAALATDDLEQRDLYCSILARVSTRDERIFDAIGEAWRRDVAFGAQLYVDYGDARALPVLEAALASFASDVMGTLDEHAEDAELRELRRDVLLNAYRALGGVDARQEKPVAQPVEPRASFPAVRHPRRLRRQSA